VLVVGVRPGAVVFLGVDDELGDGVDGDLGRRSPGGVAAHAIGDQEELGLVSDEERVLVVLPLPAHVGQSDRFEIHRQRQLFLKRVNPFPLSLPSALPWRSSARVDCISMLSGSHFRASSR
jgi:hypothetical protein